MNTTFSTIGTIIAVWHLEIQNFNPKTLSFIGLVLSFSFFNDFNSEIFKSAVLHCVAKWRICFAVLNKPFFNRLVRLSNIYFPIQAICYLVYSYHHCHFINYSTNPNYRQQNNGKSFTDNRERNAH